MYQEANEFSIDPFKPLLLEKLSESLADCKAEMKVHSGRTFFEKFGSGLPFPISPDLVIGYYGKKIGLFLLNEKGCTHDSYQPNGETLFRFRINQTLDETIHCVAMGVQQIIIPDLETLTIKIKEDAPNVLTILDKVHIHYKYIIAWSS